MKLVDLTPDGDLAAALRYEASLNGVFPLRDRRIARIADRGKILAVLRYAAHSTPVGIAVAPFTVRDGEAVEVGDTEHHTVADPRNPVDVAHAAEWLLPRLREDVEAFLGGAAPLPQVVLDSHTTTEALVALMWHLGRRWLPEGTSRKDELLEASGELGRLLHGYLDAREFVGSATVLELAPAMTDHFVYPLTEMESQQLAVLLAAHRLGPGFDEDALVQTEDSDGSTSAATDPHLFDIPVHAPLMRRVARDRKRFNADPTRRRAVTQRLGRAPTHNDPEWLAALPSYRALSTVVGAQLQPRVDRCGQALQILAAVPPLDDLDDLVQGLVSQDGRTWHDTGAQARITAGFRRYADPNARYSLDLPNLRFSGPVDRDNTRTIERATLQAVHTDPRTFQLAVHLNRALVGSVRSVAGSTVTLDLTQPVAPRTDTWHGVTVVSPSGAIAPLRAVGTLLVSDREAFWEIRGRTLPSTLGLATGAVVRLTSLSGPFPGRPYKPEAGPRRLDPMQHVSAT